MLLPGKSRHDVQAVPVGFLEQPDRGGGVRADHVEAVLGHRGEVATNLLTGAEADAVFVGGKGAVRCAADPKPRLADGEELSVYARARCGRPHIVQHAVCRSCAVLRSAQRGSSSQSCCARYRPARPEPESEASLE